jgi:methionyl-tRNA formyltransferase
MHGETQTGVTIMKMDPGMDTGDIVAQVSCAIPDDMTSTELRAHLADIGKQLLSDILPCIKDGTFTLQKQDGTLATRAPKMHKDLGHIRWDRTAKEIHDLVRGVQPWPGAFTFWRGKRLKILEAEPGTPGVHGALGQIVIVRKEGFCVQAADSGVLIKRVHPESSHAMDARAFLAGHKLTVGETLG